MNGTCSNSGTSQPTYYWWEAWLLREDSTERYPLVHLCIPVAVGDFRLVKIAFIKILSLIIPKSYTTGENICPSLQIVVQNMGET